MRIIFVYFPRQIASVLAGMRHMLLTLIFVPILGSFLLPLAGRISPCLRNFLAFALVATSFVCSLMLAPIVFGGGTVVVHHALPLGLNFALTADGLAVFMAAVSSFISAIIILYSFGYISHYEHQSEYYMMVVLFLGAMMGLVFAANLILLYVFWEITALTSWRLIGFFRERYQVVRADKAFLVTVFGALTMLLGFIIIYNDVGSFDLATIKAAGKFGPYFTLAIALVLVGLFSKSATLPFHTWLPDAGVAPSPVTALLHAAILVKIGVYVFARLFVATIPLVQLESFWGVVVPVIAGASALISAGAALVDTDLKRIIAYSTISQIGFIFLGLSTGTEIGVAGGLLYIMMHGLSKAGLFLCAGIIEQNTHNKDITKMGGLIRSMPITAFAFLFCSFSVMGIPPFGGFFAKYMVMAGTLQSGHIYIAATFLIGAFMTILYLFRAFNMIFLGEPKGELIREGSFSMVSTVAFLGVLSFFGGILIRYPNELVTTVVKQIMVVVK